MRIPARRGNRPKRLDSAKEYLPVLVGVISRSLGRCHTTGSTTSGRFVLDRPSRRAYRPSEAHVKRRLVSRFHCRLQSLSAPRKGGAWGSSARRGPSQRIHREPERYAPSECSRWHQAGRTRGRALMVYRVSGLGGSSATSQRRRLIV